MSRQQLRKPFPNTAVSRLPHLTSWPFVPPDDGPPDCNEPLTADDASELDALRERYREADAGARSSKSAQLGHGLGSPGQRVRALPLASRSAHSHPTAPTWQADGYSLVVPSYHVWRCVTASSASHQAGQGGVVPAPCPATTILACNRRLRMTGPCPVCQLEGEIE